MKTFDELMVGVVTLAIISVILTNASVKTLITNVGTGIAGLTGVILK
jgi:hypothetical protein